MIENHILYRTCRGTKRGKFLRELKEFRRSHKPLMIILLEPKISEAGADAVCSKMGKTHWIRSKEDGFLGGIWLLLNNDEIKVC